MKDITPIILILVAVCAIVGGRYILPYVKAKTEAIKANMSTADLEELRMWISVGVKAAEQLFPAAGQGVSKKEYVWDWLKSHVLSWMEKRNLTFDTDVVDAMIESEVYKLNVTSRYVGDTVDAKKIADKACEGIAVEENAADTERPEVLIGEEEELDSESEEPAPPDVYTTQIE